MRKSKIVITMPPGPWEEFGPGCTIAVPNDVPVKLDGVQVGRVLAVGLDEGRNLLVTLELDSPYEVRWEA